ncbi:uncharacterized protein YdhG (YjbR/CyaY superfamily) [Microbacterium proteolyticum]|uniref:Uncharacterized protein YdhG (YjbR/CyaY superfamily) n=1 Tax=Microbacterium proteolyticum TaxID=1572644 RepID=A0A7W5GFQ0_9MICO|nr:hypothetical protein [Microbacterium proteolyticum]MBB3157452.1 uncharacterized protein YdhG (YjbR/CyaY superfamily) [Microbacterium proteolyticum]
MAGSGAGFSDEERAAMTQRAEELKAMKGLKGSAKREKENEACLEAIDKLDGVDRAMAERLHVIVLEEAPHLTPKTFYGFPAYAKDGKVVVFYQPASKFKTRYGTVSFDDTAQLDDGPMWPVSFAVVEVTAEVEKTVRDAVRRASPSE